VLFRSVKHWQTLAALVAGALLCNKKKPRHQNAAGEPDDCASAGDPLFLHKTLHLLFFLWYEFFVHCALKVEEMVNIIWMRAFGISFSSAEGISQTHSEICRFFGAIVKTPGLISRNNFV
jgi:hypothetical protein